MPDQAGQGGGSLRRARTMEVRFRDAPVHQTCLCKRTTDGVTSEEDPTSVKRLSWSQQYDRDQTVGPMSGQMSARAAGTIQTNVELALAGFLVSRSLTLSST